MFIYLSLSLTEYSCADPECFVREYPPTLDLLFSSEERGKAGHQLPASKTLLMIGPTLNPGFEILLGIQTSVAKKSYSYVIFQGGDGPDPLSPYLDQRMIHSTSHTEEA